MASSSVAPSRSLDRRLGLLAIAGLGLLVAVAGLIIGEMEGTLAIGVGIGMAVVAAVAVVLGGRSPADDPDEA